jgi:hypothetical protein
VCLLDERGTSRTRLAALCDLQVAYWQRALGNTRFAPAREALERAAPHLGLQALERAAPHLGLQVAELLTLAGYPADTRPPL